MASSVPKVRLVVLLVVGVATFLGCASQTHLADKAEVAQTPELTLSASVIESSPEPTAQSPELTPQVPSSAERQWHVEIHVVFQPDSPSARQLSEGLDPLGALSSSFVTLMRDSAVRFNCELSSLRNQNGLLVMDASCDELSKFTTALERSTEVDFAEPIREVSATP